MEKQIEALIGRVDIVIKLIACAITEGRSQRGSIQMLSKAGFAPKDIAELVGTTSNVVRVELSTLRKTKGKIAKHKSKGGKDE